ncbi:MAG: sigma-70 family RNA polymerase sigma factor [Solirubrobacteraceae bacterium]
MPALAVAPEPVNTEPLAFDALYREHAADVFAYVMSLLRHRASAEDVTMAAFERAFRRRESFDPRRGTERAWLFGIARNAALDELRRRKRVAPLLGDLADDAEGGEQDDPLRRAAVRAALAGLDPRERELVSLKFIAGLSNAEIADVIGTSATNAGTRLHRVVIKLREACREA